jgi:hypothetical protein
MNIPALMPITVFPKGDFTRNNRGDIDGKIDKKHTASPILLKKISRDGVPRFFLLESLASFTPITPDCFK